MENNLKIYNIHTVYEGSMDRGVIDNSRKKRHSDALVFFLFGSTEYIFEDKSFTVREGSVVFLPKSSSYKMNVHCRCDYVVADFDFEPSDAVRSADVFNNLSSVGGDFEKLFHTWHRAEAWSKCDAYSQLYRIYASCLRSQSRGYSRAGELYSSAMKYIVENYSSPLLSVSDIAKNIGITEVHLRRIFNSRAATSPMRYVNSLRLDKAKNMLLESNCTVSEIAALSGFCDPYYFSREFKKRIGISPSEFRAGKI